MREIGLADVQATVKKLLLEANYNIGDDVLAAISEARARELSETGRAVLDMILENYGVAREERVAICQDTGMAVVFVKLGQDVHLVDGNLQEAVNAGVAEAY